MWRNILLMATYQVTLLLVLFYHCSIQLLGLQHEPNPTGVRNTIIFNSFVFCRGTPVAACCSARPCTVRKRICHMSELVYT